MYYNLINDCECFIGRNRLEKRLGKKLEKKKIFASSEVFNIFRKMKTKSNQRIKI